MKKFKETNSVNGYSVMTDTGWEPIKNIHTTVEYEVYELDLDNGKYSLRCADNHILFDKDMNEIFVKDLSVGDLVFTDAGLSEVTSIFKTGELEEMFDLEVDNDNHRYYTNGILSHNTQLAKEISEYMYNSEDSMIRIDMSEYMEPHTVSKLIGSPPGYVGYESGGFLTEQVRRKPHSVVLFDEVEKAHPEVFNVLLQMLDDGYLTDSLGRTIDFRNCLVILTSNTGARQIQEFGQGIGFKSSNTVAQQQQAEKGILMKALNRKFSPEFLNRIDEIIIFNKLQESDIVKILDIECKSLADNLNEVGEYKLKIHKAAKSILVKEGYDPKFGARPLRRTVERLIENPIAEMILRKEISNGDTIKVGAKDGKITIKGS
jgi:hypothetical protein